MANPWKAIAERIDEAIAKEYPQLTCVSCGHKLAGVLTPNVCPGCKKKTSWDVSGQIYDFERSACSVNREWIRRLVREHKPVTPHILIRIAWAAGVSAAEIAEMLKSVGETEFSAMLEKTPLTANDKTLLQAGKDYGLPAAGAIIAAIGQLQKANPKTLSRIADNLELLAAAHGVDISKELKKIRR